MGCFQSSPYSNSTRLITCLHYNRTIHILNTRSEPHVQLLLPHKPPGYCQNAFDESKGSNREPYQQCCSGSYSGYVNSMSKRMRSEGISFVISIQLKSRYKSATAGSTPTSSKTTHFSQCKCVSHYQKQRNGDLRMMSTLRIRPPADTYPSDFDRLPTTFQGGNCRNLHQRCLFVGV